MYLLYSYFIYFYYKISPPTSYPLDCSRSPIFLVSVVQRLDSSIHWINLYPVDSAISFPIIYPLDSDLSGG